MTNVNVVALLCLVLVAVWVQETEGYCCFAVFYMGPPRSSPCCNIFGCNCDCECLEQHVAQRHGPHKPWKRAASSGFSGTFFDVCVRRGGGKFQTVRLFSAPQSLDPVERFAVIDADGNGAITEEEAANAVGATRSVRSAAPAGW